jgi:hypothetical protein
MATIEKRTAQVGLDGGSAPRVEISDILGRSIEGVGNSLGNLAAKLQDRKEQQDNFKDQNAYRKLQLDLGQGLTDEAQKIAPDGEGFHDQYLSNVYNPARDKFLSTVSPKNRAKFETMLGNDGSDTTEWSIKAANAQKDQTTVWTKQQLDEMQQQNATYISKNPDDYDAYLKSGMDIIDASPLSTPEKMAQKQQWSQFAQVAILQRNMEIDPEGVLRDLGADPRFLSPTSQFAALKKSLVIQESGGDSKAVSSKGAIGTMQVMPGTARDIAKEIHDENFNPNWDPQQISEYLSNDTVNQRYGDYYLKKQIRDFGPKGGIEAALIAYNGGPARAKAWIESGRDDSVIPKESADYYKAIMGRLPGMGPSGKGDPKGVSLVFSDRTDIKGQDEAHVNPDLVGRIKTSFAALGIDKVKINSGARDKDENDRVGGAKGSQHLHGNAMDIDVSGYSTAERVQLIRTLSANGITGLGIGSNMIHADLGGRRAWGYANSAGGGAVPAWAQGAIADHLAGKSVSPVTSGAGGGAARFNGLDYKSRQSFINQADQEVTRRYNAESKATAVQKVQVNQSMDNELASLTRTGQTTGFDEAQVSTVLGEDDYLKWMEKKQTALRTFNAKDGLSAMTPEEMGNRLADYEPTPGSPTYAADVQVQAAVQKEIDRVTRLRATKPDQAALEDPTTKQAQDKVETEMSTGKTDPASVQDFVQKMLTKQKEFGLKPGTEAPVPRPWAIEIGKQLAKIPELGAKNTPEQVNALLTTQYKALYDVFGQYTDEVILYALAEYKGIGKNTGALIAANMQAIANGGDPLHMQFGPEYDRDAIEQATNPGVWGTIRNFISGTDQGDATPEAAGAPEPATPVKRGSGAAPSAEAVNRVVGMLNGATPEDEAAIAADYPDEYAVAKRKIAAGTQQDPNE